MNIEQTLATFISEQVVVTGRNEAVGMDEPLVSSGRMDSLGLLQVLGFVQERFGVDLLVTGEPADFDSVRGFAEAIRREQEVGGAGMATVS